MPLPEWEGRYTATIASSCLDETKGGNGKVVKPVLKVVLLLHTYWWKEQKKEHPCGPDTWITGYIYPLNNELQPIGVVVDSLKKALGWDGLDWEYLAQDFGGRRVSCVTKLKDGLDKAGQPAKYMEVAWLNPERAPVKSKAPADFMDRLKKIPPT